MKITAYVFILIIAFPITSYGYYFDTDTLPIVEPRIDNLKKEITHSFNKNGELKYTIKYLFNNKLLTEREFHKNGKLKYKHKYFYENNQLSEVEKINAEGKLEYVSSYTYEGNSITVQRKHADYVNTTILTYDNTGKLIREISLGDEQEFEYKRNDRGDLIERKFSGVDGGGLLLVNNTYGKNNKLSKSDYFETSFYDGPGSGEKKYSFSRYITYYENGRIKEIYEQDDKTGKISDYNLYKYEYPDK